MSRARTIMAGRQSGSATPRVVDFADAKMPVKRKRNSQSTLSARESEDLAEDMDLEDDRPRDKDGKLLTQKQVRARARRMIARGAPLSEELFEAWCGKPIDQWDMEELARGRVRDASGGFRGRPAPILHRSVHERILEQYKTIMKQQMNIQASTALGVIRSILGNDEVDDKGKPIVSANTKLDASKWLVEHVLGKPVQPRTDDISVKLQAILGTVMVNPTVDDSHPDARLALPPGYSMGHVGTRGEVIDVEEVDDDDY